jgi:hypothetical protein
VVRAVRTVRLVLVSYVLRLVPDALASGQLSGQVEEVESGVTAVFRDVDELVRILCARPSAGTAPVRVVPTVTGGGNLAAGEGGFAGRPDLPPGS